MTTRLSALLAVLPAARVISGHGDPLIADVTIDSRAVTAGSLFVCLTGTRADGHDYAARAAALGAAAILASRPAMAEGAVVVETPDTAAALAPLARAFFGDPARSLRLAGITGTNGKTTTSFLLRSILEAAGLPTAVIGTVGYFIGDRFHEAPNTTPDALLLNRLLAECVSAGMKAAVMEVSSHALALGRVEGLSFEAGAFTNLTRDHLDFHRDMEDYFAAKARLFAMTGGRGCAHGDDEHGRRLLATHPGLLAFGAGRPIAAENVRLTIRDTAFDLVLPGRRAPVRMRLVGRVNVENALAAAATACAMAIPPEAIVRGLEAALPPPGRFELVETHAPFSIAVDYAHTPDALERLLKTGRELNPRRLGVVFGCGGDRDRTKRPLMGEIATRLADDVTLTSDNPRTEDPERILDEIAAGMKGAFVRIADRARAIDAAVGRLEDGDLLLIAGKGHETYQIMGTEKRPFDDRRAAVDALGRLRGLRRIAS